MFSKLSDYLSYKLYECHKIEKDEINDISFSIELIMTHFITFLFIIIVGIFTNTFDNTILFLISFMMLRKYSDGYHAPTFMMCFILTVFTYIMCTVFIPSVLLYLDLNKIVYFIFTFLFFMFVMMKYVKNQRHLYVVCSLMSVISMVVLIADNSKAIIILSVILVVLLSDKDTLFKK